MYFFPRVFSQKCCNHGFGGSVILSLWSWRESPSAQGRKLTAKKEIKGVSSFQAWKLETTEEGDTLVSLSFKASILRKTLPCTVNYLVTQHYHFPKSHSCFFRWCVVRHSATAPWIPHGLAISMLQHATEKWECHFLNFLLWENLNVCKSCQDGLMKPHVSPGFNNDQAGASLAWYIHSPNPR
jgi:hypothetical protein